MPLLTTPRSPRALQRLARIAPNLNIPLLRAYPLPWWQWALLGVLGGAGLLCAGLRVYQWAAQPARPVGQWDIAGAIETVQQARLEVKDAQGRWTTVASSIPAELPHTALQAGQQYRLALFGSGAIEIKELPLATDQRMVVRIVAQPGEKSVWVEPVTQMEFVEIPAGCFGMGSPKNEEGRYDDEGDQEGDQHEVCLKQGFWLGRFEVTQEQWQQIMGENPASFNQESMGDTWREHPVETVSWNDVQEFIKKLNERAGSPIYRLPLEAEWEYAARAGTQTAYYFGDDVGQLGEYAWYWYNSDGHTHPVGQLKPNAFGLYDLHGNVWEWVADTWHDTYEGAPDDGRAWVAPDGGADRVIRGGSWFYDPRGVRSAIRDYSAPALRSHYLGFRLLRTSF